MRGRGCRIGRGHFLLTRPAKRMTTTIADLDFFGRGTVAEIQGQVNEFVAILLPVPDSSDLLFENMDLEIFVAQILGPRAEMTDFVSAHADLRADLWANLDILENVQRRLRREYEWVRETFTEKHPIVMLSAIQRHLYLNLWLLQLQWATWHGEACAEHAHKLAPQHRRLEGFAFARARLPLVLNDTRPLSSFKLDDWRRLMTTEMVMELNRGKVFQRHIPPPLPPPHPPEPPEIQSTRDARNGHTAKDALELWNALFAAFFSIIQGSGDRREDTNPQFASPQSMANMEVIQLSLAWGLQPSDIRMPGDADMGDPYASLSPAGDWTETLIEDSDVLIGVYGVPLPFFPSRGRRLRTVALMTAECFYFHHTPRLEMLVAMDAHPGYKSTDTNLALEDALSRLMTHWLRQRLLGVGGASRKFDNLTYMMVIDYLAQNLQAAHLFPGDVERYIITMADASLRLRNKRSTEQVSRAIYENILRPIVNVRPASQDVVYRNSWEIFSFVIKIEIAKSQAGLLSFVCRDVLQSHTHDSPEYRRYERIAVLILVAMLDTEAIHAKAKGFRLRDADASPHLWIDELQHKTHHVARIPLPPDMRVHSPFLLRLMRRQFLILPPAQVLEMPSLATAFIYWLALSRRGLEAIPQEFHAFVMAMRNQGSATPAAYMDSLIRAAGGGADAQEGRTTRRADAWY